MAEISPVSVALDLSAAVRAPHFTEYFGLWAVCEDHFVPLIRAFDRFDLRAHLAAQPSAEVLAASESQFQTLAGGIALIELSGPLMKPVSSFNPNGSTVMGRRRLRAAMDDPNVSGIALRIDSPGGTVAGTKELADDVAAAATKKPVYAFIEDLGASAAYWIASQATKVFTNETGIVGSIGTYMVLYDLSKMAEQDGVAVHVVKAGEFKGMGIRGTAITDAQIAEAQKIVDGLNTHFLAGVERGRNLDRAAVKELADGRVHVGVAAKKFGLVDAVTTFDEMLAKLRAKSTGRGTRADADDLTVSAGGAASDPINNQKSSEKAKMAASPELQTALLHAEPLHAGPATLAEIKAACPKAEPNWLLDQLEKNATLDQAATAYRENLEAQLAIRDEELKAEREKTAAKKPGVDPLASGGSAANGATADVDPIAAFDEQVAAKVKAGLPRAKAVAAVVKADPELHAAYVAAVNDRRD